MNILLFGASKLCTNGTPKSKSGCSIDKSLYVLHILIRSKYSALEISTFFIQYNLRECKPYGLDENVLIIYVVHPGFHAALSWKLTHLRHRWLKKTKINTEKWHTEMVT